MIEIFFTIEFLIEKKFQTFKNLHFCAFLCSLIYLVKHSY